MICLHTFLVQDLKIMDVRGFTEAHYVLNGRAATT